MVDTLHPPRFGAGQQPVKPAHSSRRLAAAFDFATANHFRAIVFLVLCGIVLFLPGFFTIPPIDRDEARFAQATKQMVESGDFVDIRFQDDVRYKKPVGLYWLQTVAVETASALGLPRPQARIWLYRIPCLSGGPGAGPGARAALLRRDLLARRRTVLPGFRRRRPAGQFGRSAVPGRAAPPLFGPFRGDVLAGRAAAGHGGACDMAGAARARRAI